MYGDVATDFVSGVVRALEVAIRPNPPSETVPTAGGFSQKSPSFFQLRLRLASGQSAELKHHTHKCKAHK